MEVELDRELAYHIERRAAELVSSGMDANDARRRAAIELGGVAQAQERVRDTWTWRSVDALTRDVRQAVRSLRKSRGFTLGAGIILTLGIGVNTALFSVVHAVLLEPLAYPQADRLVAMETVWTNTGERRPEVSGPDFLDWQAERGVFDLLAHASGEDDMSTTVNARGGFGNLRHVSADFFGVFNLPPAAGRLLSSQDAFGVRPRNALLPVVVGYEWATTHFGSASDAIGETFLLYRAPVEIVGVAARGFQYPDATNIWIPASPTNRTDRSAASYVAVGRLRADLNVTSAQAALRVVADRLAAEHAENRFKNVAVVPLQEKLTGNVQRTLWMLMAAVTLILLIGCANIANLLLARSATRAREFALRAALGAGRTQIVRQLLTESSVLAGAATAAGVLLAYVLVHGLIAWAPIELPRLDEVRIDGTVLLFALATSAAAVTVFSVAPALKASKLDVTETLKSSGAKGAVSGSGTWLRSVLVVVEVALSVLLLAGAGLLVRSFQKLNAQDLGFTIDGVVSAYTQYALDETRTRPVRTAFYRDLLPRVRALPGVVAAAGVSRQPLAPEDSPPGELFVEGRPSGSPGERLWAFSSSISTEYYNTLDIPLRAGRDFNDADTAATPRVVIVNEALARAAFRDESAIGRRISSNVNGPWLEIVGVAADTRWRDPSSPAQPEYYNASSQGVGGSLTILARTAADEGVTARGLLLLLQEVDPSIPVRTEALRESLGANLAYPRFRTLLVSAFGGLGLLLASVGVFSVLAYLVGQRTRELAVRRAVGASSGDIVRLVLVQGARLVGAGLLFGVGAALAGGGVVTGFLYQTSPWDAATYGAVVTVLACAGTLAMVVPAIRAATIDPLTALRHD
ncbi:MAG: ABC transporter permease [Acidobacteria bacterium]|nr:ABC transporter permease [Acidobacteriota bacterium]